MSKLDCVITVKGTGTKAAYGKPAKDTTKTVREFLVDNVYYYTAVTKHLRECKVCDPIDCLQVYLDRRKTMPRFEGKTSSSLATLAIRFDRILRKRGSQVPPDMLAEFVWRSNCYTTVLNYRGSLSVLQKAWAVQRMLADKWQGHIDKLRKDHEYGLIIGILTNTINPPTTEQEFLDLIAIAEVHIS
jgi:hypothetical protein